MTENEQASASRSQYRDGERPNRAGWQIAGLVCGILALIFMIAVGAGFVTALVERGNVSAGRIVIGAIIAALTGLALWVALRSLHALRTSKALSRRDRRNILFSVALVIVGAVMGMAFSIADHASLGTDTSLLGTSPISPAVALALAFATAIVLPVTYWYYHRHVVDELEEAAYREGALYALYSYVTIAPTWWMLWRGGWVREPDGQIIFLATILIWLLAAMRAKYR